MYDDFFVIGIFIYYLSQYSIKNNAMAKFGKLETDKLFINNAFFHLMFHFLNALKIQDFYLKMYKFSWLNDKIIKILKSKIIY